MGIVIKANCAQCDYDEEFYLGAGLFFENLEFVKKLFNKDIVKQIEEIQKNDEKLNFKAEYVFAVCKKCGRPATVPNVEFRFADGSREKFCNACSCGHPFETVNYGSQAVLCPVCRGKIRFNKTGQWD